MKEKMAGHKGHTMKKGTA